MQWTPEIVRSEMADRQRAARQGNRTDQLRAARAAHPSLWHRIRSH